MEEFPFPRRVLAGSKRDVRPPVGRYQKFNEVRRRTLSRKEWQVGSKKFYLSFYAASFAVLVSAGVDFTERHFDPGMIITLSILIVQNFGSHFVYCYRERVSFALVCIFLFGDLFDLCCRFPREPLEGLVEFRL